MKIQLGPQESILFEGDATLLKSKLSVQETEVTITDQRLVVSAGSRTIERADIVSAAEVRHGFTTNIGFSLRGGSTVALTAANAQGFAAAAFILAGKAAAGAMPTPPELTKARKDTAWLAALGPLFGGLLAAVVALMLCGPSDGWGTGAVLGVLLWRLLFLWPFLRIDYLMLQKQGFNVKQLGLAHPITLPYYLFSRAKAFGHSKLYGMTWSRRLRARHPPGVRMMHPTLPRTALAAVALAGATLASPAFAQTPKFSCPVALYLLTDIAGNGQGGLDKPVYGVRARDWKPEFLDQALRAYFACQAASPGPQSLKDAERADALRQMEVLKGSLQQRDRLLALEARQASGQAAAAQSGGSTQVAQTSGTLSWTFSRQPAGYVSPTASITIGCGEPEKLPQDLLTLTPQAQQELPKFYAACIQAQQVPGSAAVLFKESVEELAKDRQAQAGFVAQVRALIQGPAQQQTEQNVAALEKANRFKDSSDPSAIAATSALAKIRVNFDEKECAARAKQAGIPENMQNSLYLIEWATPTMLAGLACRAGRNGVRFRYEAGGLVSKEGFEIKGVRTVRVTVQRDQMPDGRTVVLVPVSAKVGNQTFDVTRQNLGLLAMHVRAAINNE